ncbi:MAG: hypothetical protein KJ626_00345 [Verrucomicrobia bacterium]|nr:hypothetical protein [Verrucomicrobiota bacterium]
MKTRILLLAALLALTILCPRIKAQQPGYCCILDRINDPAWLIYGALLTETDIDAPGAEDFSMAEFGASGGLAFFRTSSGVVDIRADLDLAHFMDDGGIGLPDDLLALNLDADWVTRVDDTTSLRAGFKPGLYAEAEGLSSDSFFFPFSLEAIYAFQPNLSGLAGVAVYPDFDQQLDPLIGLRWIPGEEWVLDLFYPASRITFQPSTDWSVSLGLTIDKTSEYQLDKSDDRDRIMIDQDRLYIEAEWSVDESTRVMCQFGRIMDRSIEFEGLNGDFDVDDTVYFRIGVGGMI